jgi:hypothetical protein
MMGGCATLGCCQLDSVYTYSISQRLWERAASLYTKAAFFTVGALASATGGTAVHVLGGYSTTVCAADGSLVGTADVSNQHTLYSIPRGGRPDGTKSAGARATSVRHTAIAPRRVPALQRHSVVKETRSDSSGSEPRLLPGVESLGYGYNLLKGNPFSSAGGDPGWSTRSVLDFGCSGCLGNASVLEGRFIVPQGVSVNALRSCAFETRQMTIQNTADLQEMMSAHVELRAGLFITPLLFGARFSQSDSFALHAEAKGTETTVSVVSVATCEAYVMALEDHVPVE